MFTETLIPQFVDLLKSKNIKIYHACQYIDFCTYLEIGGIPSRMHMESQELQFTRFETDTTDRVRDVWDKVFFNIADFGKFFANGSKGLPSPYGPILFVFEPEVLFETYEVALCLRSAGEDHFSRSGEALKAVVEVEKVFEKWESDDGTKIRWNVLYGKSLVPHFPNYPQPGSPELSCAVNSGFVTFKHLSKIEVDPFTFTKPNGMSITLTELVRENVKRMNLSTKVFARYFKAQNPRQKFYNFFSQLVANETPTLVEIVSDSSLDSELQCWAKAVQDGGLDYIFRRYMNYLREGTISPIMQTLKSGEE